MSETVQQLTSQQVADLHRQLRERDAKLASLGPTEIPAAPLPPCPACEVGAERIDQRVEDPQFGVDETALRMRWLPCGHRFRAVVDLDAGPVRPDEEPDDGPEDGGHDFQWGDDHVQRCARCTLPHSQWAGGACPGPEHPLKPGEYV